MTLQRRSLRLPLAVMHTRSSSTTKTLPRLPVPDLLKTLDKYLVSIEPFLRESVSSPEDFSAACQLRRKWADQFYSGIGQTLQQRLVGTLSVKLACIFKLITENSPRQEIAR